MRRVGAFEAKTHLAQLLDEVARGETIEITRHGVPVAHIVPPVRRDARRIDATIAEMRALRQTMQPVSQEEIRSMRDEGRQS